MNRNTKRFFNALLVALCLMAMLISPTYAQSSAPIVVEPVQLVFPDGRTFNGRHAIADDFVIVCPFLKELPAPHPCNQRTTAAIQFNVQFNVMDDYTLVCPFHRLRGENHPCNQQQHTVVDDFVLVCPVKGDLGAQHPCSQRSVGGVRFEIPKDYVLTCPVKEVLDPNHPCADR